MLFFYWAQCMRKEMHILEDWSFWVAKDPRALMTVLQEGFYNSLWCTAFPLLDFSCCQRAQVPPASTVQQCWMLFLASLEPLFLSCPFQPQTTATKFKCYQSWPVFKQGRVYTCMIQTLLRSTFTTKVINLSMKQIIFWALQDMANLIETGKLTACWKKKY